MPAAWVRYTAVFLHYVRQSMTQTVKVGDAVVHEVLDASELQHLLRQLSPQVGAGNLRNVTVTTPSELNPTTVDVSGAFYFDGKPYFWEVQSDLRGIKSADDVIEMCHQLEAVFSKAQAQLSRPA